MGKVIEELGLDLCGPVTDTMVLYRRNDISQYENEKCKIIPAIYLSCKNPQ
jgi:hypothetical protein